MHQMYLSSSQFTHFRNFINYEESYVEIKDLISYIRNLICDVLTFMFDAFLLIVFIEEF